MRVLVRSLALALAIGVVPLASVAAHECIVVNRSATGNQHASGSGQWITVTLTQIYEETENFGFPDLTPAQVAYAANLAASTGVPGSFTFRSDTLLPPSRRVERARPRRPTARASTTSSTSTASGSSARCSPRSRTPDAARDGGQAMVRSFARRALPVVGVAFVACLLLQVFLAGLGVFDDPRSFITHREFGYLLGWFTLVMLVLALLGRQRRLIVGLSALTLVQFALQSVFVALRADYPAVAALHPLNGFLIVARHRADHPAGVGGARRGGAEPHTAASPRRRHGGGRCLTRRRSPALLLVVGPLFAAIPVANPRLLRSGRCRRRPHRDRRREPAGLGLLNAGFVLATIATSAGLAILAVAWDGGGAGRVGARRPARALAYAIGGVLWCVVLAARARTTPALADLARRRRTTEPAETLLGAATGRPVPGVRRSSRRSRWSCAGLALVVGGGSAPAVAWFAVAHRRRGVRRAACATGDLVPAVLYPCRPLLIGVALLAGWT